MESVLTSHDAESAERIQAAIDSRFAAGGGMVLLPEMDLTLDRGLELRDGVALVGQGPRTVLRKGAGRVYPLTGYHNYGMCDVPLTTVEGLRSGMTVSVLDDKRGGFYSTFARIAWVGDGWVGLDHGIEADYAADANPRLTTAHPLVFAHGVRGAAVRNLRLVGRIADDEPRMDGCRGGAVYFARCRNIEVADVTEESFHGEGLGFQMCRDMRILRSRFLGNTGNGLHPGAGSTGALFEACAGEGNGKSGFYFCVRATRISVRGCVFAGNAANGVSIGTRDCFNLIEDCTIEGNGAAGILTRQAPAPIEVHSCMIRRCTIGGNCMASGRGQVEVLGDAHDLAIVGNRIGCAPERPAPGIFLSDPVRAVRTSGNAFLNCRPEQAGTGFRVGGASFACGYETMPAADIRHLPQEVSES